MMPKSDAYKIVGSYIKKGASNWVTRTVLEQQVITGRENRDAIAISETAAVQQTEN